MHNSWKNESTGQSPFEILMGYSPRAEIFDVTLSIPTIALWLRDWKRARKEGAKTHDEGAKEVDQRKRAGTKVQGR